MATTYAMPAAPGHNGHGGHGHSHSRKSASQKLPPEPPSSNRSHYMNRVATEMNSFQAYNDCQNQQVKAADAFPELHHPQSHAPNLLLPKPSSFSTPTSVRSKSMERRKSVGLPTHLNLQGVGYGYPRAGAQKFQTAEPHSGRLWITSQEAINAILVPLPYALASLVFGFGIVPHFGASVERPMSLVESIVDENNTRRSSSAASSPLALACGLTALTLAIVGLRGKFAQAMGSVDRGAASSSMKSFKIIEYAQLARRVVGRILTVGLPYYATSHLGGVRVATVLLLALASNIAATEDDHRELSTFKGWKRLLKFRKFTVTSILLQLVCDVTGMTNGLTMLSIALGYLSLSMAILVLPPPFPSLRPRASMVNSDSPAPETSSWGVTSAKDPKPSTIITDSSLTRTPEDINITLAAAALLGLSSYAISLPTTFGAGAKLTTHLLPWGVLSACTAVLALTLTEPATLRSNRGIGFALGSIGSCVLTVTVYNDDWRSFVYQSILISVSFAAYSLDTHRVVSRSSHSHHHHHQNHKAQTAQVGGPSRFTNYILHKVQPWPLLHTIIMEKDSRRIFYFMCLNFAFMIVQTFYGIVSGSLGLLSDSIHMFFDCLALVVGLSAAVMSKWPPSRKFPYGYAKIETLAGFANGVFLMLISVEIVTEALERLASGRDIKRLGELMVVSILGLAINLIGILAFGHAHHGHDHGHGHHQEHGHDHTSQSHCSHEHGHDHSHHSHRHHNPYDHQENQKPDQSRPKAALPALNGHAHHLHDHLSAGPSPNPSSHSSVPATPSKPPHSHSHGRGSHGHDHHHSENMMGIYLHVLGDALGSVAVVLSTYLISINGWSGWDPLASTGIAIIIFGTAIPLVKNCAQKLLLTVPGDTEYDLREALAGLSGLRGVVGYAVPKFWLQDGEQRKVMGVVHVTADKVSNLEDVKERCVAFLIDAGLDVLVQVERDGVGSCWCQAST